MKASGTSKTETLHGFGTLRRRERESITEAGVNSTKHNFRYVLDGDTTKKENSKYFCSLRASPYWEIIDHQIPKLSNKH